MEILIFLLVLVIVYLTVRSNQRFVYFIVIADIVLRLIYFIQLQTKMNLFDEYLPSSLENVINRYSSGMVTTISMWILFIIYVVFVYYLIKEFLKRK